MTYRTRIFSMLCCILIWQVLLASCSGSDDNSPVDIGEDYVNQQILLSAPDFFNTFNTEDSIYIELRSYSKNEIIFPNDYNLRIFERNNGDWIEIYEIPTTRSPAGDVILSLATRTRQTTYVTPDLADRTRRYQLRIYVIGDMKTDEGIKQVAAYVDLELRPPPMIPQG